MKDPVKGRRGLLILQDSSPPRWNPAVTGLRLDRRLEMSRITIGGQKGCHDWIDSPLADLAIPEAVALDARVLHGSAVANAGCLHDHFYRHDPVKLPNLLRLCTVGFQPPREDFLDVLQIGWGPVLPRWSADPYQGALRHRERAVATSPSRRAYWNELTMRRASVAVPSAPATLPSSA